MWSRALRRAAAPAFRAGRGLASTPLVIKSQTNVYVKGTAAVAAAAAAASYAMSQHHVQCDAAPPVDWNAVRKEIVNILDADYTDSSYDGATPGPLFLRLAWHSAGTACVATKTGGSNGATMRFNPELSWGANAGLKLAQGMLEPVKQKFPGVSYSDLWIFAACVAVEEMGGNKVPFTPGRTDKAKGFFRSTCPSWTGASHKDGRLPDADKGDPRSTATHLRYIFNRMGMNDQEIVALSGAHGLGACHTDRSGFWGPWTRAPTTISTEYYRELLENTWTIKTTHKGKPWNGPTQFEDPTGDLMMLPSDIVLIQDKEFRKYVEVYAKDSDRFLKDFSAVVSKLFHLGC